MPRPRRVPHTGGARGTAWALELPAAGGQGSGLRGGPAGSAPCLLQVPHLPGGQPGGYHRRWGEALGPHRPRVQGPGGALPSHHDGLRRGTARSRPRGPRGAGAAGLRRARGPGPGLGWAWAGGRAGARSVPRLGNHFVLFQ